jgi:hypothetical protein
MTPPANRKAPLIVEELNGEYAMSVTHPPVPVVPEGEPTERPYGLSCMPMAEIGDYDDFGNDDDFDDFDEDFDDDFEEELEDDYAFEDDDEFLDDDFTKDDDLGDAAFDGEPDEFADPEEDASKPGSDDEDKAAEDKD